MTDWNLSDKLFSPFSLTNPEMQWVKYEDVSEFIKRLKEEIQGYDLDYYVHWEIVCKKIDALAGVKLS